MRFFLAFFAVLTCSSSLAQHPAVINYKTRDGLSSSQVYSVFEDSKGFIWFASDGGVSRFDGYVFRNFSTENGLVDNTVFGITEDSQHRIWFRGISGKLCYFANDSMHSIPGNARLKRILGYSLTSGLYADKDNVLWIGIDNEYYFLKVTPPYDSMHVARIPVKAHYAMQIAPSGLMLGGSPGQGKQLFLTLFELNRAPVTIPIKGNIGPGDAHSIYLRNGDLLYAYMNHVLKIHDGRIVQETTLINTVLSVREDREGHVWAGTKESGVWFFENGDLKAQPIRYLNEETVTAMLEDKEGGYWFSTLTNGVYYMPSRWFLQFDKSDGLSSNFVNSLVEANGRVLAAYDAPVIDVLTEKGVERRIGMESWTYLLRRKGSSVLVGGHSVTEMREDLSGRALLTYDGQPIYATAVSKDRDGGLWIGSVSYLFHDFKGKIERIRLGYRINALAEDSSHLLYVGTREGLLKLKDGKLILPADTDLLLRHHITDIAIDSSGRVLVATKGAGILMLIGNKAISIGTPNGLASNICKSIFIESDGVYWIGTNRGLSKIMFRSDRPANYRVETYNVSSGLSSNEINQIIRKDHNLWLATSSGITYFDPRRIGLNASPPPVYITSVEQGNRRLAVKNDYEFRYNENYIMLSYVGLSYRAAGKLLYKYRMEGIDTKWHYTRAAFAQFPTLPPGRYKFLVQASNNSGVWSKVPAVVYITVKPPFWRTWWFALLCVVSGIAVILGIFISRLRKIRLIESEKARIDRRIGQLELKALRAQMNPHFIFNAINSIQYFILQNDPDHAYDYLIKFSKLIRNVLENSKNEMISLSMELETLDLYIRLEALRFEEAFEYRLEVQPGIDAEDTYIPSMILQPLVENAIWHGLMPRRNKGLLSIRVESDGNRLSVIIEDNGVGRNGKAEADLRQGKKHRSMGMMITQERLNVLNDMNQTHFGIDVIDLVSSAGIPCGTRIIVTIPLKNS